MIELAADASGPELVLNLAGEGEKPDAVDINNLVQPRLDPVRWARAGRFIIGDITNLPIRGGCATEVLGTRLPMMADEDRNRVAAEAFRVLKTGGTVRLHSSSGDGVIWGGPPQCCGLRQRHHRRHLLERGEAVTTTDQRQLSEAQWLLRHPAPIHTSELAAWQEMVRWELSDRSLGALFSLLVSDDDELSYQAMAAARALGLTVWAAGTSNDSWDITMPTGAQFRLARPEAVSPLRGRPSG